MSLRPAKRHYSEAALELWLERLAPGWEHLFSPEVLAAARAVYRKGEIREVGLFSDEATVYAMWDGGGVHAVLEWKDKKLAWRTSLERPLLGETLVAAGIYEIEELLGDEAVGLIGGSEITDPRRESKRNGSKEGDSQEAGQTQPREEQATTPNEAEPELPPVPARKSPRDLVLVFTEENGSAICRPVWEWVGQDSENARINLKETIAPRLPAYGKGAVSPEDLLEADRTALLRLATHARKCGFGFDAKVCGYRMDSPSAVMHFVNYDLPVWSKRWRVEGKAAILPLGRELPPLELEAVAEEDEDSGGFTYRWRLGLEGEWLPESATRRLLEDGGTVFVPGRGFARLGMRQQSALTDWPETDGAMPRYSLLSLFNEDRVKVAMDAGLAAWREALLREPESPKNVPDFLRPYQVRGVAWLAHMLEHGTHPLLADEMGLGKTIQVLALLHMQPLAAPVLIVCPASVVPVWEAEAARFFPATPIGILQRGKDFVKDSSPKIWLASYTQLRRNKSLLEHVEFSHAVLDEAQYIKNPSAKVTETCLAIKARHRLALTGTPIENHPLDIWTIFRFLMPGLLGRRAAFETRLENDPDAIPRLAKQVAPFVLRRTKNVVAKELPPKVSVPLLCPMSETQRELYRRLVDEGISSLGNAEPGQLVAEHGVGFFALLIRLRQAACDPGLLPGQGALPMSASGKISVLLERLEEIVENKRKVVIFSQFVGLLDRVEAALQRQFPMVPLYRLTGSTTDRATPVSSFQKADGAGIMLVSLRAGGIGITLHSAEYVFLLDPWWNPAVEAQAVDRVHRIGQKKTTFVYRMISADTVEARVEALKAAKAELFANVVGDLPDMSNWSEHFPSLRALIG
ncbi:MAG: DEAD/DEAH box helicase [Puniceicoccales bacterium]|jgi:superfamily II DNA or RNA helicase|nr:DEAD/DEAH box helicase [Puniceicoccales bacterium]